MSWTRRPVEGLPVYDIDYDFLLLAELLDRLRDRLRIAVLFSGDPNQPGAVIHKTHNPRPWKSYEPVAIDIAKALQENGFQHVHLMAEDMRLISNLEKHRIDIVWLNTGGVQGYDPMCQAPALLEMLGLPYIGHNPLNSATLDNKRIFKHELLALGVPTPPFLCWNASRGILNPRRLKRPAYVFEEYEGPFVVKPVSGRASLHVHVVDSIDDLPRAVSEVYQQTRYHVLIERYLSGPEFCIAVAGPVSSSKGRLIKREKPFAFSPVERVFETGERIFTSMDQKPITQQRARLLSGEAPVTETLVALSQQIYLDLNLKTLVRVDCRTDASGNVFVLECNPKPDLKKPEGGITSLVTLGLGDHQMTYNDLILSLLADRLDHFLTHRKQNIRHIVQLLS
jgi:D-alanine-D-alanine ligase